VQPSLDALTLDEDEQFLALAHRLEACNYDLEQLTPAERVAVEEYPPIPEVSERQLNRAIRQSARIRRQQLRREYQDWAVRFWRAAHPWEVVRLLRPTTTARRREHRPRRRTARRSSRGDPEPEPELARRPSAQERAV
jgi:hypothetical protein